MIGCPTQVDGLEIEQVSDGFVIYHMARDRIHYVNHTAALILSLCDGTRDRETLIAELRQAYDLTTSPAPDVDQCLKQLRTEGLVI